MGGAVALSVGLGGRRPRPAGILALSGFLPTVDGWRLDLPGKRAAKVWISHGAFDNIIPVDFGRGARRAREGRVHVTYRESRMPHWIDPELLPELRGWLRHVLTRRGASRAEDRPLGQLTGQTASQRLGVVPLAGSL